jgi:hypothetical protein
LRKHDIPDKEQHFYTFIFYFVSLKRGTERSLFGFAIGFILPHDYPKWARCEHANQGVPHSERKAVRLQNHPNFVQMAKTIPSKGQLETVYSEGIAMIF